MEKHFSNRFMNSEKNASLHTEKNNSILNTSRATAFSVIGFWENQNRFGNKCKSV